jgi:hypothetical protein
MAFPSLSMNKGLFRCIDATNCAFTVKANPVFLIFINQFNCLHDFHKASLEHMPVMGGVF